MQSFNHIICFLWWISVDHALLLLSQTTPENKRTFYLLGVLCGLALYNKNIIDFPFPLALFKKLLNAKPTLEDMKEFSSVGRSVEIKIINIYLSSMRKTQVLICTSLWCSAHKEGFRTVCIRGHYFSPETVMSSVDIFLWVCIFWPPENQTRAI